MPPNTTPPGGGIPSKPTVNVELNPATAPGFAAIVRLCGEHDLATGSEIVGALEPVYGNVLVDLTTCEFIDSTVISVLIVNQQARQREGQRLELLVPPENTMVRRTLEVSGVTEVLSVRSALPSSV
jgi:anti-anti-sigma factor